MSQGEEVCRGCESGESVHGEGAGRPSEAAVSSLQDRPDRRHGCGGDRGQADLQGELSISPVFPLKYYSLRTLFMSFLTYSALVRNIILSWK